MIGVFVSDDPRGADLVRKYQTEHEVTFPIVLADRMVLVNYLGLGPSRPQYHVPVFFFIAPDGEILEERDPDRFGNEIWFGSLEANIEATARRLMPPEPAAKKAGKGSAAKKSGGAKKP